MNIKKIFSFSFLYLAGAVGWLVLFAVLQSFCIINTTSYIDKLWTKKVNENFVEDLTGSLAFKVTTFDCGNKYIYSARYYPNGVGGTYQIVSLDTVVDLNSWKEKGSDNISTTYTDNNFNYVLYNTSDGVSIKVFDK